MSQPSVNLADMLDSEVDLESTAIASWYHDRDTIPTSERLTYLGLSGLRVDDYISRTTRNALRDAVEMSNRYPPSHMAQSYIELEYQWVANIDGFSRGPSRPTTASGYSTPSIKQDSSRHNSDATTISDASAPEAEYGVSSISSLTSMTTATTAMESSLVTDAAVPATNNCVLPEAAHLQPEAELTTTENDMGRSVIIRGGSVVNTEPVLASTGSLPCIFHFLNCPEHFRGNETESWKVHCTSHLLGRTPTNGITCGGCPRELESWNTLLDHLAAELLKGRPLETVVPHVELARFLERSRIIGPDDYRTIIAEGNQRPAFGVVDEYYSPKKERQLRERREFREIRGNFGFGMPRHGYVN